MADDPKDPQDGADVQRSHRAGTPDGTAHGAALYLIDALAAVGIEVTSAREVTPQIGEPAVRVGILAVSDVMTLCGLLRAEEARRRAAALESDGGEGSD